MAVKQVRSDPSRAGAGLGPMRAELARASASSRRRARRIQWYQHGFVEIRGDRALTYRWEDIDAVSHRLTAKRYRVTRADGERCWVAGETPWERRFVEQLLGETSSVLLSRTLDELVSGHTVPFGPFAVHPDGISHGRKLLPWDQVSGIGTVGTANRRIVLHCGDSPWAREPLHRVPNPSVFLTVARSLIAGRAVG